MENSSLEHNKHVCLDEAVRILERFHCISLQSERMHGFSNGCEEIARLMVEEFKRHGYDGKIIVANSQHGHNIAHESGSLFKYHHVVLCNGLVFDPNYSQVVPIPLKEYPTKVYSEGYPASLWFLGDTSKPFLEA